MRAIRTFVAVSIEETLKRRLSQVQLQMKRSAADVKWVAPDNLHVTLKFLGDVEEAALPTVFDAVGSAAAGIECFDIALSGVGAFPNAARPRVVWVGVTTGRNDLIALAKAVETELVKAGFVAEDKPFKAHITIGRAKNGHGSRGRAVKLPQTDTGELGSQRVSSIAVMQSDLRPDGPVYSIMKTAYLAEQTR